MSYQVPGPRVVINPVGEGRIKKIIGFFVPFLGEGEREGRKKGEREIEKEILIKREIREKERQGLVNCHLEGEL